MKVDAVYKGKTGHAPISPNPICQIAKEEYNIKCSSSGIDEENAKSYNQSYEENHDTVCNCVKLTAFEHFELAISTSLTPRKNDIILPKMDANLNLQIQHAHNIIISNHNLYLSNVVEENLASFLEETDGSAEFLI